jgi:hypothetical protein
MILSVKNPDACICKIQERKVRIQNPDFVGMGYRSIRCAGLCWDEDVSSKRLKLSQATDELSNNFVVNLPKRLEAIISSSFETSERQERHPGIETCCICWKEFVDSR